MEKTKSLILGIILIVVGIILGLNALNITNINIFFAGWWSLFIIVPSFVGLFTNKDKIGSCICLIIGILLLLGAQDIIDYSLLWQLLIPIFLIALGVSFLFKSSKKKQEEEK